MSRARRPREPGWGSLHPLLDLHGLTADEASRHAELWLRTQQGRGERVVVLVTGRGNRSASGPVLRGEVEHLLSRLAQDVVVRWEPTEGGGAVRVQLAPLRPTRAALAEHRTAQRIAALDPRLRAQAEEALWELGITPTPALIDAELRRRQRTGPDAGED